MFLDAELLPRLNSRQRGYRVKAHGRGPQQHSRRRQWRRGRHPDDACAQAGNKESQTCAEDRGQTLTKRGSSCLLPLAVDKKSQACAEDWGANFNKTWVKLPSAFGQCVFSLVGRWDQMWQGSHLYHWVTKHVSIANTCITQQKVGLHGRGARLNVSFSA